MSFEDERVKRASRKEFIARVQVKRLPLNIVLWTAHKYYIPSFTLEEYNSISRYYNSGIKLRIFTYNSNATYRLDHYELTEVASSAAIGECNFYYDVGASRLYLSCWSTPTVTPYFYFYVSLHFAKTNLIKYTDPLNSNLPLAHWQPRILSISSMGETISNILEGFVSCSSGSLAIDNIDNNYDEYIEDTATRKNSFYNSPIDIWHRINGEFKKVFNGQISSYSYGKSISFNFEDFPRLLSDTANYYKESYYNILEDGGTLGFSVEESKQGMRIPFMAGFTSKYRYRKNNKNYLLYDELEEAVCVSHDATVDTNKTLNRIWLCCAYPWNETKTKTGNITSTSMPSLGRWRLNFSDGFEDECSIGDTLTQSSWTFGNFDSNMASFIIDEIGTNSVVVRVNFEDVHYTSYPNTGNIYKSIIGAVVVEQNGRQWYCMEGYHYRVVTSNSPAMILIEFADNFESQCVWWDGKLNAKYQGSWQNGRRYYVNHSVIRVGVLYKCIVDHTSSSSFDNDYAAEYWETYPLDAINSGNTKVYYKYGVTAYSTHGAITTGPEVLEMLLNKAGLITNGLSFFTQAGIIYHPQCTIVLRGESYQDLIATILRSICGYLTINDDFEIVLKLIDDPATSITIGEDDYLLDSKSVTVDYNDLYTRIVSYNPDIPNDTDNYITIDNPQSQAIYGIVKEKENIHCLLDIFNNDIAVTYAALISNPKITTQYNVKLKTLISHIGDGVNNEIIINIDRAETSTNITTMRV